MGDFKVGDIVRIIKNSNPYASLKDFGLEKGDIGTVMGTTSNVYPIIVKFNNRGRSLACKIEELELVNGYEVDIL